MIRTISGKAVYQSIRMEPQKSRERRHPIGFVKACIHAEPPEGETNTIRISIRIDSFARFSCIEISGATPMPPYPFWILDSDSCFTRPRRKADAFDFYWITLYRMSSEAGFCGMVRSRPCINSCPVILVVIP